MGENRKNDGTGGCRSQYRTDRLIEDGGSWYFLTREGTVEGPFECKLDALEQLEVYVRLAVNDLLVQESALSVET